MPAAERTVEHSLQIHVAFLATLSGVLIDVSQNRPFLALILLTVAATSIVVTDRRGWFQLPRFVVSLITLGAVLPLLNGFLDANTLEQLLAISHLLTIWLAVMFFQAKTPRVYGSLIVLSLLMVVVAAVLSGGALFGVLLLLYVFGGLSAMCLLYILREEHLLDEAARQGAVREEAANRPEALEDFLRGQEPIAYQLPNHQGSTSLWVSGLPWQIAGLGLATLVFSAGFFSFIPRLGQGDWSQRHPGKQTQVGFSSRVTFEEMGEILESNQLAMRVTFYEADSDILYPIFGDCYFFGQAMAIYYVDEKGQASWRPYELSDDGNPLRPPRDPPPGELVRQEFILEPNEDPTVFSIAPAFAIRGNSHSLLLDRHNSRILRGDPSGTRIGKQLRYALHTTGLRNGAQMPMSPYIQLVGRSRGVRHEIQPYERELLTRFDPWRFPRIVELARRIVDESEEPDNRILILRRMQSHFINEMQYTYTLDMREINQRRRRDIDPVEDFVANHKMGHCKYFASALVLMLRSQNIPARLVVGYHGGEYNRLGRYYQVYERDAHAWVEAYLEPEHIPDGIFGDSLTPGSGAWYRLDPTPARSDPFPLGRGLRRVADQTLDYIQLLWTNWVLDMNPDRQPEVGLEGLAEEGTKYLANLRVVSRSFEIAQNLLEPDRQDPAGGAATGGRFATILAGLLGLLLLAAICVAGRRFLLRRRHRRVAKQELERRQRELRPVAFYVRLEKLLEQLGYHRQPTQTQREFIHSVDGRLKQLDLSSIPFAPEELVELYYRVRFGHRELGTDEAGRIAVSLDQLENSLQSLSVPDGQVG